ncbi:hypothetical protein HK414_22505 [Ramlibacter terrae]|uniref:Uncharacterized protein n=1 Tax=Ramlibacter terrae TaxID=2732511 RepID=A0ABX6P4Z1_9BURK|nr:hypothetical protein HK414_22505 [Ramlibacter terrae]
MAAASSHVEPLDDEALLFVRWLHLQDLARYAQRYVERHRTTDWLAWADDQVREHVQRQLAARAGLQPHELRTVLALLRVDMPHAPKTRIAIEVHGPYSNEYVDRVQAIVQSMVNDALAKAEANRRRRYEALVRELSKDVKFKRFGE